MGQFSIWEGYCKWIQQTNGYEKTLHPTMSQSLPTNYLLKRSPPTEISGGYTPLYLINVQGLVLVDHHKYVSIQFPIGVN